MIIMNFPPPQPQQMPLLWPYFSSVSIDSEAVARDTGCPPLDHPARNILVSWGCPLDHLNRDLTNNKTGISMYIYVSD